MSDIKKYNLKTLDYHSNEVDLNSFQEGIFISFDTWFSEQIEKKNIRLYYRGVGEEFLRKRMKKISRNKTMKFLFHYGEKSKSNLKENIAKREASNISLGLIQDISEKTFDQLFDELQILFSKRRKLVVKEFKNKNPDLVTYFLDNANKSKFLSTSNEVEFLEKHRIRNYYLRLLHTIYSLGEYNYLSCCVSLTEDKKETSRFKGKDGLVIYYWLPEKVERFGTSYKIISSMGRFLYEKGLPTYFTDFYPKQREFTLTGGLFPHHIIGYQKAERFIVNNHIINGQQKFNNEFVEAGLDIDQKRLKELLSTTSEYGQQNLLYGNLLYSNVSI